MPSLVSSTAKERLHILIATHYYLHFFCQIILVPSLVLELLAEVSRLISLRSYVKIAAADTSYFLTSESLDRR